MTTPKQISIKLATNYKKSVGYLEMTATVEKTNLSDHEYIALLFAVEFAINNKGSEILGQPVRAHIFEKTV